MTAVLLGIVFVILGALGLMHWFHYFCVVVCGIFPISILIGGVVAIMSGVTSLRSARPHDRKQ